MSRVSFTLAVMVSFVFLLNGLGSSHGEPSPAEIDRLIRQLGDEEFSKREEAGKRLSSLGECVRKPLLSAADSNADPEIRRSAVAILTTMAARSYRELACLTGHTGIVWSVVFSPDGKQALSAGEDKTVRLWDLASGKELRRFEGHTHQVRCVVFSPDGKYAVSGSFDKAIRLWDLKTGHEIRQFLGHELGVTRLAFGADGKHILSGGLDGTIRLWNVENGKELCCLAGHTRQIGSLSWTQDGKKVLSTSNVDQTMRLWDVNASKEVHSFTLPTGCRLWEAKLTNGGREVICGIDNAAQLWNLVPHLSNSLA